MKELEIFIKELNLVFTKTITRDKFCIVNFNLNEEQVDYHNSINIRELVNQLNNLYQKFIKEYNQIGKLNLGKHTEIISYEKYDNDEYMKVYVSEPNFTNESEVVIYIHKTDNKCTSYATNNRLFESDYYKEEINIEDIEKYIELFKKYKLLFEMYKMLRNKLIFSDGTNMFYTKIDGAFLERITNIEIYLSQLYFNTSYSITIRLLLGDRISFNIEECEMEFDGENKQISEDVINYILDKTYINKNCILKNVKCI